MANHLFIILDLGDDERLQAGWMTVVVDHER